ncbi:MAG: tetratricopeptide repeat protein [Halieaceae bacterium]|jgi:Flp pilus assembly protein TadD|nr:tetratricopeptide repeat protein [Halieaceae bacterium]
MSIRPSESRWQPPSPITWLLPLLLSGLLAACAGVAPVAQTPPLPEAEIAALRAGASILRGNPMPAVPDQDILALDADMRRFLEQRVEGSARLHNRLEQLLNAVVQDANFGLNYEGRTRTARETFQHRNGNCLAFTNMFVAMARSVGLDARFQEVDIPPVWDRQGDTIVLNRHINVNVQNVNSGGPAGMLTVWGKRNEHGRVVDFNVTDFRSFFRTELISDRRAFAHYYSNLGAEEVRDGNLALALAYLNRALELEPGFAAAWTNLGVVYARVEDLGAASRAYELALYHDPDSVTALSNLASVLQRRGQTQRAQALLAEVESYRSSSPYYRHQLALESAAEGDFEDALAHLKYAVRKQPREERFHFALSAVYTALGEQGAAARELDRAMKLASNPLARKRYELKIRQLQISLEEAGAGLALR